MASIGICNRISEKNERLTLNQVNIQGNVADLKGLLSEKINVPPQYIELVYCGQCLQDQKSVDCYGVKTGSTVYALRKQHPKEEGSPEPLRDADIRQLKNSLRSALINQAYRSTVERLLADPEELDNLLVTTPGLENDPVAIAMLHDPELLAILIHPANINSVLEAHPSLTKAATLLSAIVNKEELKPATDSGGAGTSSGTYSLDQMSDEEDNMTSSQPSGTAAGRQGITTSQLAAALSAATGSLTSPGTSRQSESQAHISTDFLQQSLMQAQGAHAMPPDPNTIQMQLQQLRDMGIADEAMARRALQASGGDIQMALDLIFGDGSF